MSEIDARGGAGKGIFFFLAQSILFFSPLSFFLPVVCCSLEGVERIKKGTKGRKREKEVGKGPRILLLFYYMHVSSSSFFLFFYLSPSKISEGPIPFLTFVYIYLLFVSLRSFFLRPFYTPSLFFLIKKTGKKERERRKER